MGTSRFSFSHLRGTSPILNMSVSSANRINYVNSSFSRTLLGTVVSAKFGVPSGRGNVVFSSNTVGSGISLLSTDHTLFTRKCGVCTATKATTFLGTRNMSAAPIC